MLPLHTGEILLKPDESCVSFLIISPCSTLDKKAREGTSLFYFWRKLIIEWLQLLKGNIFPCLAGYFSGQVTQRIGVISCKLINLVQVTSSRMDSHGGIRHFFYSA